MTVKSLRRTVVALAALALFSPAAHAQLLLGPGTVAPSLNDGNGSYAVVDSNRIQNISAGLYQATIFFRGYINYSGAFSGNITPFVAAATTPGQFTVLALGATQDSALNQTLQNTAFGGSDTFSVASTTMIFGGFFWDGAGGGKMPIPFQNSAVLAGNGSNVVSLASLPSVGSSFNYGAGTGFLRSYQFAITVQTASVPEPSPMLLTGVASVAVLPTLWWRRLRARRAG